MTDSKHNNTIEFNHYAILEVDSTATLKQIKQAYRRLAKLFHPDSNQETADHERTIQINAAYEVLSDPQSRQSYDQLLSRQERSRQGQPVTPQPTPEPARRTYQQQRPPTPSPQKQYHVHRPTGHDADEQLQQWLKQVYAPVNRLLCNILNSLTDQLEQLSADPFDDQLMEAFQNYLEKCHQSLNQAQMIFRSLPNPTAAAGAAVHLYYCLNQVGDGLEELRLFTFNYDDHYLHTGQELFRIAVGLRCEAQATLRDIA